MRTSAWTTLILLAIAIASPSAAQDSTHPDWVAACNSPTGPSRVVFHSLSGDVVEDDMQVRIIWRDGNSTVAAIRQAWFKPSRFVSDTPSTCTGIGAFELSGARLLLWIRYDGRPHFDHLAVLLVDLTQQVVLDAIEDLGEIAWPDGQAVVLTRAGHFESLLIKESLLDRIGGGEFGRPDWMTVTVTGKKLRAQWRN